MGGLREKRLRKYIITAICLCIAFLPEAGLPQGDVDNIYGDYAIGKSPQKVSLDLRAANLNDVLKMLSRQTGLNFVSTETVKERVLTLYMDNVPLKEAMDIIFKANNLGYDFYPEAKVFVVKELGNPAIEVKTKVYYLKYITVNSSNVKSVISAGGETAKTPGGGGGPGGGASSRGGGAAAGGSGGSLTDSLKNMMSELGKISEDPLTNSLIITDIPTRFPLIEELLSKLDVPIPQVMIEVEMLDVSRGLIDQLGFNFTNGFIATFTPGGFSTPFPLKAKDNFNLVNKFSPISNLGTPGGLLSNLDFSSMQMVMQFLNKDTSTRFLARPRILTLVNESAEVDLTMDEVVSAVGTSSQGTGPAVTTTTIERKETGTKLTVTPQVNLETGEVIMSLNVSNKESKISTLTAATKDIETRGTKSMVRLKDGDTLLIGGLIRKTDEDAVTKIPFISEIPVLGRLFRYKNTNHTERELCVFLTPHIIIPSAGSSPEIKKEVFPKESFQREQANYAKQDAVRSSLDKFSR